MDRPEPLQRLLYASHAIAYPWPYTMLDIARVAEPRNAAAGISGCLFFSHTHFLQVLEGSETALTALWQAIARDRRHRVLWIGTWPIAARRITGLPMGYVDVVREAGCFVGALARADRLGPRDADDALDEVMAMVARRFPSYCAQDRLAVAMR